MSRTKQEIRDFLESKVGHTCVDKSDPKLNGQCVCLIKNLMEFLGVANPYAARGNARDAGDAYIAQGIGKAGQGWLTICVNRDMGGSYGHVWVDLLNEANYESNGAKALATTKNTRPIKQAQQFVNFDQWVGGEDMKIDKTVWQILAHGILGRNGLSGRTNALDGSSDKSDYIGRELDRATLIELFESAEAKKWRDGDDYGSVKNINKRLTVGSGNDAEDAAKFRKIKELLK